MRVLTLVALVVASCTATPNVVTPSPSPSATERPVTSAPAAASRTVPFELVAAAGAKSTRPTVVVATSQQELEAILQNTRVATYVASVPALAPGSAYLAAFAGILPLVSYPVSVARIASGEVAPGSRIELRDATTGASLARVTYCGSIIARSPLDADDAAVRDCVWTAYSRGDTAQFLRRSLTTEGGPIVTTLRAVPGGLSEVSRDDRLDGFASRPGVHSWACEQIARSTTLGAFGQTVTWYSLSRCTGDGTDVDAY